MILTNVNYKIGLNESFEPVVSEFNYTFKDKEEDSDLILFGKAKGEELLEDIIESIRKNNGKRLLKQESPFKTTIERYVLHRKKDSKAGKNKPQYERGEVLLEYRLSGSDEETKNNEINLKVKGSQSFLGDFFEQINKIMSNGHHYIKDKIMYNGLARILSYHNPMQKDKSSKA